MDSVFFWGYPAPYHTPPSPKYVKGLRRSLHMGFHSHVWWPSASFWPTARYVTARFVSGFHMGMDQYLLIPFLMGWTSIYQLFWGSLGTRVLTHPHMGFPWDFHIHPGHAGHVGHAGHGHAAPESQGLPKRDPFRPRRSHNSYDSSKKMTANC